MTCSCSTPESTDHSWEHAMWLDERNAARTAYLAQLVSGTPEKGLNGTALADSFMQLYENALTAPKSSFADMSMIQNGDQLHAFLFDKSIKSDHLLRNLDLDIRKDFFAKCTFIDEETEKGRYRYVYTFYFGTLVNDLGLGYEEVFSVGNVFGMSSKLMLKTLHRFGQICSDGTRGCQPRAHWYCSGRLC